MKIVKTVVLVVVLLLAIFFPHITQDAGSLSIAFFTLLYISSAVGWNLFSGYTGYMSLSFATFSGLGAYTLALICTRWNIPGGYEPFFFLPVAGLVAAIFAIPIGLIALRTRQATFAIITISMLFIFQLLAYNLNSITNSTTGLYFLTPPWIGDSYDLFFYYVALILALVVVGIVWWIRHSKFGLGLLAIRDDEDRALGLGIKTGLYKLVAFAISAFVGGMVGGLGSYFNLSVMPTTAFDPAFNIVPPLMTFFGGSGTLLGPIVGAAVLEPLQQYMSQSLASTGTDTLIFGALLLVVLIFLPEGIVPSIQKLWFKLVIVRKAKTPASGLAEPEAQ